VFSLVLIAIRKSGLFGCRIRRATVEAVGGAVRADARREPSHSRVRESFAREEVPCEPSIKNRSVAVWWLTQAGISNVVAQHRQEQRPWEEHDPKAPPRHNVSVRLNDYHLAMLQYVAMDTASRRSFAGSSPP
jgi:hypothetical protein